jgi:hypothetical protein
MVFALGVSWEAGRCGFMPLDQSVVFDGGWRMLSGQVPWRDFDAPSFVTPSAIQALFFGVFGVNWWSYLLHAMVANALFAGLILVFARRLGLGELVSVALALGSAVLFYPPVGTPFADQESVLFTTAALVAAWFARTDVVLSKSRVALLWQLVPSLLALAFFSKQLPAALAPLALALIVALPSSRPRREAWFRLVFGLGILATLAGAALVLFHIDPARIVYDLFELPLAEAEARRALLPASPLRLVRHFLVQGSSQGLWTAGFVHLGSLVVAARWLYLRRKRALDWTPLGLVLFGELCFHIGVVTLVLTNNQDGGGVAWTFFAAAPVLAGLRRSFAAAGPALAGRNQVTASALLVALVFVDGTHFHGQNNLTRAVNDMVFDRVAAPAAGAELAELAPLLWATPEHHAYPLDDLIRLIEELRTRDGDLFLVGDSALIYGLVGSRSTSPSLWFHPGVSLPKPGTRDFGAWQAPLVEAVESGAIARIVVERAGTWIGNLKLSSFPRVARAVRDRGFQEEDFGAFRVLELSPRAAGD